MNPTTKQFGTVCGHYLWDNDNAASVVCRQLGFTYGELYTYGVSNSLPPPTSIAWGYRKCTGTEQNLFQCPVSGNPSDPTCGQDCASTGQCCSQNVDASCNHGLDQGAICYNSGEHSELMHLPGVWTVQFFKQ